MCVLKGQCYLYHLKCDWFSVYYRFKVNRWERGTGGRRHLIFSSDVLKQSQMRLGRRKISAPPTFTTTGQTLPSIKLEIKLPISNKTVGRPLFHHTRHLVAHSPIYHDQLVPPLLYVIWILWPTLLSYQHLMTHPTLVVIRCILHFTKKYKRSLVIWQVINKGERVTFKGRQQSYTWSLSHYE